MLTRLFGPFLLIAILASACAVVPPIPPIESSRGDRIGLSVEIGAHPGHTHIGTTIFHNFAKEYPYRWDLESRVRDAVARSVTAAGFTVVDLDEAGLRHAELEDLVIPSGETWTLGPGKEPQWRRLRDEFGLRALFVLKQARVVAALECGAGGCSTRVADVPGLYTRDFFGFTTYMGVAAFTWDVFVLDPLADLTQHDSLSEVLRVPATPIPYFVEPADFDNIREAEFEPIADAIVGFSGEVARRATALLHPR